MTILNRADDLLRGREGAPTAAHLLRLGAMLVVFGMLYGAVMGSYGGWSAQRVPQVLYSALKVPLLLVGTFLLSLPTFFVLNTLLGLRDDFAQALRAVASTQSGLTVILASLAPLTAFWYVSFGGYQGAILLNLVMFAIASAAAQRILRRHYQPLIRRRATHRWMVRVWGVIYGFVGIQMAWVLRPFVGDPNNVPSFFREGAWGNAYVRLAQIIWAVFGGQGR